MKSLRFNLLLLGVALAAIAIGGAVLLTGSTESLGTVALAATGQDRDHSGHEGHDHEGHLESDLDDDHEGHEDHKDNHIATTHAGPGVLRFEIDLPGEVKVNGDRTIHVGSRVPGVVKEIRRNLGDTVRQGDILAIIESRELAEAKATYLAAGGRSAITESRFSRENDLWQKRISSEEEYLEAKQEHAEARIELQLATHQLQALGLSQEDLQELTSSSDTPLTEYCLTAPQNGTVIERDLHLGDTLAEDACPFVISDLSSLWVDLSVSQSALQYLRPGQEVSLSTNGDKEASTGKILFISPVLEEETRTALTRVLLPNRSGHWRPGLFAKSHIAADAARVPVLILKEAIQLVDEQPVVFVPENGNYEPRQVSLGRTTRTHAEVVSGLSPGEEFVTEGAFELKAILVTSGMDAHAGHGH